VARSSSIIVSTLAAHLCHSLAGAKAAPVPHGAGGGLCLSSIESNQFRLRSIPCELRVNSTTFGRSTEQFDCLGGTRQRLARDRASLTTTVPFVC
jgi:hypothetical protein